MNYRTLQTFSRLITIFLLFGLGALQAATDAAPISGSYQVISKTDLGSHMKVLVRLEFTNHGQGALVLQEVLLSDFAHPSTGSPHTSSITLRPGIPEKTTQEFVIPRAEFEQWLRGVSPRVILQLQTATGVRTTNVVRLAGVSFRKGE